MERLTKRGYRGYSMLPGTGCNYGRNSFDCQMEEGIVKLGEALERLAEYEDAEEQGLFLRLPFLPKPGMKIYDIYGCIENGESEPREITIRSFDITHARMWLFHINQEVFTFDEFGKTYFLTREEAKSALAEKGGVE